MKDYTKEAESLKGKTVIIRDIGNGRMSRFVRYSLGGFFKVNGFFSKSQELMVTALCDDDIILMLPMPHVGILWEYESKDGERFD